MTRPDPRTPRPLSGFSRDTRGSVSVELIIVIPMLLWALAASVVFYDGFRTRYHAQMAAQTVSDIMSRETDLFTADYVEGMNDVFDFLVDARIPTRIRVSSVIWDSANMRNRLQWSYGTRDLTGLPTNTFELMQNGDLETLLGLFGEDTSYSFASAAAQMPVEDLPNRIPPVLPGEALLMVEAFALWTPFTNVGIGRIRFAPVVVVRPRFAPWINFDGIDPVYPEADYEILWTGGGNDELPDPNDPDGPPDDPGGTVTSFTFDSGVTTGWSHSTTTAGSAVGGSFLGPFGRETYADPVTLAVNLGTSPETATIEFDLLILDSWDGYNSTWSLPRGDTISILIDGTPITLDAFVSWSGGWYDNTRSAAGFIDGMQYQVTLTRTQSGSSFFGSSFNDSVWRATLTLANPPAQFALGFSAGIDSDPSDESFGIDNLRYSASGANTGRPFFTPDARDANGIDPFTRFRRYSGCPELQISAPWLTLTNSDLQNPVSFLRQVGGPTDLGSCGLVNGRVRGSLGAEPALILNYDSQSQRGNGRRLQIRMDDGNNGYTCDSTMLIRDPNGQWWFNDDISGWNAGLRMGNASSGTYAIWLGTYNGSDCTAQISFSRY